MTTRTQPSASRTIGNFGRLLKQWRERRRLSQLALAVDAEISSRHLSFIETGRAQPSRDMVLLLSRVLEVPPRGRNDLLTAAGYAPVYRETGLEAPEMVDVRRALDFMMRQQEPYPGLVIDGHWNILMTNGGARRLMGLFLDADAVAAVGGPPNAMRLFYHPRGMRPFIVNWEATAAGLIQWLHRDLARGIGDAERDRSRSLCLHHKRNLSAPGARRTSGFELLPAAAPKRDPRISRGKLKAWPHVELSERGRAFELCFKAFLDDTLHDLIEPEACMVTGSLHEDQEW